MFNDIFSHHLVICAVGTDNAVQGIDNQIQVTILELAGLAGDFGVALVFAVCLDESHPFFDHGGCLGLCGTAYGSARNAAHTQAQSTCTTEEEILDGWHGCLLVNKVWT